MAYADIIQVLRAIFGHTAYGAFQICISNAVFVYGQLCMLYTNQIGNSLHGWEQRFMHVNGNISGMFSFISHVNSLVRIQRVTVLQLIREVRLEENGQASLS